MDRAGPEPRPLSFGASWLPARERPANGRKVAWIPGRSRGGPPHGICSDTAIVPRRSDTTSTLESAMRRHTLHAGLVPAAALVSLASAQGVPLTGMLSDSTTGPLAAGVYVANTISVPAGETLTIDAGVVIKFEFDTRFDVEGTLIVDGTPGNPVIFTETRDDVGGDTNGDG